MRRADIWIGGALLAVMGAVALLSPYLAQADPRALSPGSRLLPPSARKSSSGSLRWPPLPAERTVAPSASSAAWRSPRGVSSDDIAHTLPPTVACDLTSMSPWRGTPILRPKEFVAKVDGMRRHRCR